uniref:Uncharacterized protein n=1 Tax=Leersia perrieri TaxID=77586 RepID=A0A0D9VSW2_9ORYZ
MPPAMAPARASTAAGLHPFPCVGTLVPILSTPPALWTAPFLSAASLEPSSPPMAGRTRPSRQCQPPAMALSSVSAATIPSIPLPPSRISCDRRSSCCRSACRATAAIYDMSLLHLRIS